MSSSPRGWNDLPIELRIRILEHRLVFSVYLTLPIHDSIVKRALLPLALVNHHIRDLATQIYYESNTFVIRPESSFRGRNRQTHRQRHALFPVPHPNPAVSHWVRKLELQLPVSLVTGAQSSAHMLTAYRCYLNHLLIPDEPREGFLEEKFVEGNVRWQRNFQNLNELKIVLKDDNGELDEIQEYGWRDMCHINLRAKQVEVVLEDMFCSHKHVMPHVNCRWCYESERVRDAMREVIQNSKGPGGTVVETIPYSLLGNIPQSVELVNK